MSGNGGATEGARSVDPVKELDDVIRLIHFLGQSKPGGFTAALGWAEEKLCAVREEVALHSSECGESAGEAAFRRSHTETFPLMSNLVMLHGGGNGA